MTKLVPPWKFTEALCAEIGTEIFYIEDRDENISRSRQLDYEMAKRICNKCSHITQCAQWAINKEKHGFWGGLTPLERKKIRGRMNIVLEEELPSSY